nr:DUF6603 domain-containing protein [Sporomusa silvacetica]
MGFTVQAQYSVASDQQVIVCYGGNIHGVVGVAGNDYTIIIALQDQNNWEARLLPTDGNILPGLGALAGLAGGRELQQSVQSGLQTLGIDEIAIDGVIIGFDLSAKKLNDILMNSHVTLHGLRFNLSTRLPDFQFGGSLAPGNTISFKSLFITYFGFADNFPDTDITMLTLSAYPQDCSYSLGIEVTDDWNLSIYGDKVLAIEQVLAYLTYTGGAESGVTGSITGKINLAGMDILVTAEQASQDDGWTFSGSGAGQEISLTVLTDELLELLGLPALPAAVPAIIITNLAVSFNTKTLKFTFHGETVVSETNTSGAGIEFSIQGTVDICSEVIDNVRKMTGYVEGDLNIGSSVFTVRYDMGQDQNVFCGSWQCKEGESLGVADLAGVFGLTVDSPPPELDLALKSAAFYYYPAATAKPSRMVLAAQSVNYGEAFFVTANTRDNVRGAVLGVDYRGDLNLSDLPVIGQQLHCVDCVTLQEIRIFVASAAFDNFQVPDLPSLPGAVQSVSTADSKPFAVTKGVTFKATIQLVDEVKTVTLPVGHAAAYQARADALVDTIAVRDEQAPGSGGVWINIQRTFGPISFRRLGFTYSQGKFWVMIDAGLSAAALAVDLEGLSLGMAIADPADIGFSLDGMDISFKQGPVVLTGGFENSKPCPAELQYEFNGMAVIRFEDFAITGLGSYAVYRSGEPSMFIYAMLAAPIGGVPCFFVTGVAGGFGYNRGLSIPLAKDVATFPLIQAVMGQGDLTPQSSPAQALQAMSASIYPSVGEYWLAAGIRFTTFELLNSFAMVVAKFGTTFEVALLGLSILDVPAKTPRTIAHVELALAAIFSPAEGALSITAALTSASYILDKACHLIGEAAFYMWFAGEHTGDFVVSVGGYHPQFIKPQHYPAVARLGINWMMSSCLSLTGTGYFAITPSCVMAGGRLNLEFHDGNLKAWLTADADFLIEWEPFHYDIQLGVSVGASYRISIFGCSKTFKVELGAKLHIWGPDFACKARINWWIISFTISFGNTANVNPRVLTWEEFSQSFLHNLSAGNEKQSLKAVRDVASLPTVCRTRVGGGLIKDVSAAGEGGCWIINPEEFCLVTNTSIPATAVEFNGTGLDTGAYGTAVGIRPMGVAQLTATHVVVVERQAEEQSWQVVPAGYLTAEVVTTGVPEALWSQQEVKGPSAGTIKNVPVGISVRPAPVTYYELSLPNAGVLCSEPIERECLWANLTPPANTASSQNPLADLMNSIMSDSVVKARAAILASLSDNGFAADATIDLSGMAASAVDVLQAPPEFCDIGAA